MFIKNRITINNIIQFLALTSLAALILLIIKPGIKKVHSDILNRREDILLEVEELTGLEISYHSMSPLILNSLELNKVLIKSTGGVSRASLNRVIININLFNVLFNKQEVKAPSLVDSVIFIDGAVDLNINDIGFVEKLTKIGNYQQLLKTKVSLKKITINLDLEDINISLMDVKGSFSSILSRYYIKINSLVKVQGDLELPINSAQAEISINSFVSRNLMERSSSLIIKDIITNIGSIQDLNFDLDMYNDEIEVTNRDNKSNLDYYLKYRMAINEFFISVNGDSFKLEDFFVPKRDFNLLDAYMDSSFSGDFKGVYNVNHKSFLYSSLGQIQLTEKVSPVPVNMNFHVVGDLDYITIYSLNAYLNSGRVSYSGGINLNNYFPSGHLRVDGVKLTDDLTLNSSIDIGVINDNFINLDFRFIDLSGVSLDNLSSIIYVDETDISFQALKREGKGKLSLSGNYNLTTESFSTKVDIEQYNPSFLESILPFENLKRDLNLYNLNLKAKLSVKDDKYDYEITHIDLNDSSDKSILFVSGRGNEKEFSIDDFLIKYSGVDLAARLDGRVGQDELEVNIDTLFNGYKYLFNVGIGQDRISARGSYGFDFNLIRDNSLYVNLTTNSMPITFQGITVKPTIDFRGVLYRDGKILFSIPKFITEIQGERFPHKPTISFIAEGSEKRVVINDIIYSDNISPLTGRVEISSEEFKRFIIDGNLKGQDSEDYKLNIDVIPKLKSIVMDVKGIDCKLSRLQDNKLSGKTSFNIALTGDLNNFKSKGHIESRKFIYNKKSGSVNLDFNLNDRFLSLTNLSVNYDNSEILAPLITYNFGKGRILGKIDSSINYNNLKIDTDLAMDFSINPLDRIVHIDRDILSKISGKLTIGDIYSNDELLFKGKTFRVFNNRSAFQLYSKDRKLKLFYSYSSGLIKAKVDEPYITSFKADGTLYEGSIDLDIRDISIDGSFLNVLLPLTPERDRKIVEIKELNTVGQIKLKGNFENPTINGLLAVYSDFDVAYIPETIDPSRFTIKITDNKFSILPYKISIGNSGVVNLKGELLLDSWLPESINLSLFIPKAGRIPVQYKYDNIVSKLKVYTNGININWEPSGSRIDGRVVVADGEFYTEVTRSPKFENSGGGPAKQVFEIDLVVEVGSNNKLYIPNKALPILEALANPGELISIKYNSIDDSFYVVGKVSIMEGQIDYSGRPFIIKEGEVILNLTSDNIDPYIKLVGANNLIDEDGRPVEILLKYEGSILSDFKPVFTSNPSKSEEEILILIGLAFTGSSVGDIAASADFFTDAFIGKPLEDSLKGLLGVDFVKFESEALSSIITNITNNSFEQESDTEYNDRDNLSRILNNTSLSLGNFITKDFFVTGSIGSTFNDVDKLGMNVEFAVELNTPHFLLGFNVNHDVDKGLSQPEFGISLDWVLNPRK